MKKSLKDILLLLWYFLSTFLVVFIVFFIIAYVFKNGIHTINKDFLLDNPKGMPLGKEGGIFPAIVGSLLLMFISSITASILGIATAVYLTLYNKNKKIDSIIHIIIHSISGIPSIVLGLFGYSFLVFSLDLGISLLAGAITLSIMIFPYIEVVTEKAIEEVDKKLIVSSYSLGIDKTYTFFKIILPQCIEEIVSGIMLSGGFAMGATAPIMLTSAVISAPTPDSIMSPVMALSYHLYILISQGISMENAYGTAFVLMSILIILNFLSMLIVRRRRV
ncbi:phosphate ABC transporter permease PstA [Clostridium botulinum]|uniref:Phosphate transport system permease protein PstA n=1 Tax=Clostridium botulinum (strain Langeland / NCTC 10281 / Type F) TaxID=441772 RepID=A7GAE7_CLOBL|nr:phosphate ABC transporter permease PstA [Clostridium botulinum]ABS40560.1 phosphate uptake ABC transporter, PhoT family, permease protein [Clostridium botulinum F str. Langeland]ADF98224.1 phosphate uptake ABC transporter, PhoT family, permease protein [Clostridium botulinum F str. 230613]KKM41422.1 phosphate ABC transporter permease [Clostridium botulinum]MBY6794460.1 phosphate ABC transporter permease PstA [Clostridium botulinum]MBY6938248.1 phosphate ABC transporter permease PstA [Clostr